MASPFPPPTLSKHRLTPYHPLFSLLINISGETYSIKNMFNMNYFIAFASALHFKCPVTEYSVIYFSSNTAFSAKGGALDYYRKALRFKFPLRTLMGKVCRKPSVAVKMTQVCKRRLYNPKYGTQRVMRIVHTSFTNLCYFNCH